MLTVLRSHALSSFLAECTSGAGSAKKLLKLYKDNIKNVEEGIGREPYHIRLRKVKGYLFHITEGRLYSCKNLNEFADALGKDRKEVRELVRRDP